MAVNILTDMALAPSTNIVVSSVTDFPDPAHVGQVCMKNGILYLYSQAGGGTLQWYPLTNIENSFTHAQNSPASTWTVTHAKGSTDYVYQVYDTNGEALQVAVRDIDADSCEVLFNEPIAGTITLVFDASSYGNDSIDFGTL